MEQHPDFAKGYNQTADARVSNKRLWDEIGARLNSHGPPIRSPDVWKKVCCDYKYNIKKKLRENKRNIAATGGGPSRSHKFSSLEENVIRITNLKEAVDGNVGAVSFGDSVLNLPNKTSILPSPNDSICINEVNNNIIDPPENNNTEPSQTKRSGSKGKNELIEQQIKLQQQFHDTITRKLTDINDNLIDTNKFMKRMCRLKEKEHDLDKKMVSLKEREIQIEEMELELEQKKMIMGEKDKLEERKFKVEHLEIKRMKLDFQTSNR